MKKVALLLFLFIIFNSNNVNTTEYQPIRNSPPGVPPANHFFSPVKFTSSGVRCFLRHTLSNPNYVNVLALDFSHMLQFLNHGKQSGQQRVFAKSVLRLFGNKLKAAPYVNAYAFSNLLNQLPNLLKEYFLPFKRQDLAMFKSQINDILYTSFLQDFSDFQQNPNTFLSDLSDKILTNIQYREDIIEDISVEDLRKTMMMFLEVSLNKLIWSPQDKEATWHLIKVISQQLEQLLKNNLITDPNDLNDLYISLLERYCFFLDIAADKLPLNFFRYIKKEVATTNLLLFELEEQEKFIEPKKRRFKRALLQAEAKARASEYGILTS